MNKPRTLIASGMWAVLLSVALGTAAQAQDPRWEFKINAGYNIGGSLPLPLPAEIRKIEKYTPPLFTPHVALEALRRLNKKWGLSVQLTLDHKGFTVRDEVKHLHTEIELNEERYVGHFTGKNTTRIHNVYIVVPVSVARQLTDRWQAQAGIYLAYLNNPDFKGSASDGSIRRGDPTGEKTRVNQAAFDFSDRQNRFDYGMQFAAERSLDSRFALRGQIAWGLRSLFPDHFTGIPFHLYNIYGTLGVSYRLNTR